MSFCEKCASYDMCKFHQDMFADVFITFFPHNESCPFFKNKADFVEVVRCKNCSHGEKTTNFRTDCTTQCNLLNRVMIDNDFCSYGKRKKERF